MIVKEENDEIMGTTSPIKGGKATQEEIRDAAQSEDVHWERVALLNGLHAKTFGRTIIIWKSIK